MISVKSGVADRLIRAVLTLFTFGVVALLGGCGDAGGGASVQTGGSASETAQARPAPPRTSNDHLGNFVGVDPGGIQEFRLDVRENSVTFVIWSGFDATRCRGSVPGGVRPRSTVVELDCGSDMAIAGVEAGIQMDYSGGRWTVYGTGAFSGLSATLGRR